MPQLRPRHALGDFAGELRGQPRGHTGHLNPPPAKKLRLAGEQPHVESELAEPGALALSPVVVAEAAWLDQCYEVVRHPHLHLRLLLRQVYTGRDLQARCHRYSSDPVELVERVRAMCGRRDCFELVDSLRPG